ncbi:MAG: hypothetical protein FJ290_03525 [Planctomycetes bacterium]|nr:hypothetical protein [Planctomycetota bacterium]
MARLCWRLAPLALLLWPPLPILGGELPKKVYAHYMGCWPAGSGALAWARHTDLPKLRHDRSDKASRRGGHVRNFDLVPPELTLTPEQSADLEIRRALRIGLDGFAIDAWAGEKDAKRSLDALFAIAEAKDYPFEITICLDPICGGGGDAIKYLLDKHGKSPKLARRNGKPLILGYATGFAFWGYLERRFPGKSKDEIKRLRGSPEAWNYLGDLLREMEKTAGQPCFFHIDLGYFFHEVPADALPSDPLVKAAGVFGRHANAIGAFTWAGYGALGPRLPDIAKATQAAGAEWACPIGMYWKENIPYELFGPKGTEWVDGCWADARSQGATLLQIVTWNDYGENTNIAPAWNTRYAIYDLTGYHIRWWRTGSPPAPDRDRIYLSHRKYAKGAKAFPFAQGPFLDGSIEVLTILPRPASIRLPGRNAEYAAPAGYHREQFPVTPGPVVAELVRDGKVEVRLESPEAITDRPFREDNAPTCWSTEEERLWKEDFGDKTPMFVYSEYGDADRDGLPNWFEMYWFGKWGDMRTATVADPKADPHGTGKTNLQHYLDQTDPTLPPLAERKAVE